MCRAASKVDDTTAPADRVGEAVQKRAVERLVLELAGNLVGVLTRDTVVRLARVVDSEQAGQPPAPTGPVGRL